jgi:dolichol-phosphate mannosyltransferase
MLRLISIVVPTHNEQQNVEELHSRIARTFAELGKYDFELIFVDDSTDSTPATIQQLHSRDPRVKLVRLVRSFGQAVAIAAGLKRARGDAAIMMDADLQDPPEAIPELVAHWEAGSRLVYVERESSANYLLYRTLAKAFYWILGSISSIHIPRDAGEFRLIDRAVIDFMNGLKERSRFMRGLTVWPGFSTARIRVQRAPRLRGQTNYNLRRSLLVAVDGFVSFSVVPLRVATVLGLVVGLLSMLLAAIYVGVWIFDRQIFGVGWMSLFLAIMFMGSLNLLCVGIVGEYVGRVFLEVQGRPLYCVDYEVGIARDAGPGDSDDRARARSAV